MFLNSAKFTGKQLCQRLFFNKVTGQFTWKHLCQSLFLNKVTGLGPATLLKKTLWHRSFPVTFAKFLRTPFLTEHLRATASQYSMGETVFYSFHYRNGCLAVSYLFHMFTQSIKLYPFHFPAWKMWFIK